MKTKEYTFQNLFGSRFRFKDDAIVLSKIEIPIIQRDYAQGRNSETVKRIRKRFLNAFYDAIVKKEHMTLDFIYGDVSKSGVLTPLDGQQRLTTLFLLHWYIAKKEMKDVSEYDFLNNFSYAVRFSSRDFCQELVKYHPDFSKDNLSDSIQDESWYPYEWKNDPTIKSMLVMIDALHEKFHSEHNLWESLVIDKNISFYFLPLSEMGLTDDLYIKMNSRGKPLTPFEHFKAEFEEVIRLNSDKLSKEINHKLDIEWTDIFFPFRGSNSIIDDEFMRYFQFISNIISYQSGVAFERDEFKLATQLYGKDNEKAIEHINYLKNSFDCWSGLDITEFFNKLFSRNTYEHGKTQIYQDDLNIFKECCDNYGEFSGRIRKFPLNKTLLLFSIITYLQNKGTITEDSFKRRIRIVRNLIWNSQDEVRDNRMQLLLFECEKIILSGEIPISEKGDLGFNVKQKDEERNKIEWLESNDQMKEELFHLEDHHLLKGCIAVVGLDNYNNFKKFRLLHNDCDKDVINRALLSTGDYSQHISWRYQIGAKRNSVWFDLFHPSNQRQGFDDKTKATLNTLLFNIAESEMNNDKLEELISEYLNNSDPLKDWRYYFVKYEKMRKGNFGMYYWKDRVHKPYEIIMMNTEKSIGGRNWDIYLYTLSQLTIFKDKLSLGEYSSQGDILKIKNTSIEIKSLNDKYVVTNNDLKTEYPILQSNGVDIEDRIEMGTNLINELLDNIT